MIIAHLTDSHDDPISNKVIDAINNLNPDIIIHTGDIQNLQTSDLSNLQQNKYSQQYMSNYLLKFSSQILFTAGNHDVQSFDCSQFLFGKKHLKDNIFVIGVPGSVSSNLPNIKFWKGYPHGPEVATKEFIDFNSRILPDDEQFFTTKVNKCPQYSYSQYNIIASQIIPGEKYIIVSHQGPFYSQTSLKTYSGQVFSFGSPGIQTAIEEFSSQIILVVHGHTHFPIKNLSHINKIPISNPGCAFKGSWAIYNLEGEIIKEIQHIQEK